MNNKILAAFVFAMFLLALATIFSRCTSQEKLVEQNTYLNHNDTVAYVGSQECKSCHASIYESFSKTGMGQSFGAPTKQKSSGSFKHKMLFDSFSNLNYKPFWKNDSLYLFEFRIEKGDTVFKRIEKVDYIVGSGQHTNSHIQEENGYLHQMPFTYYTQKGVLSLPPGFEDGNNSRYNRALGMECISCHNGLPDHVDGSFNKFSKVPLGIDCERCHGPGEAHVKLKRAGVMVDVSKEIDYSIVNPAKLEYSKQKDLCQRCHLQGNAILKADKDWEDFKPGMDISDVYDVFMPKLKNQEGAFIMAAHPDRLRQSACFLESQKTNVVEAMTCITCHNPHQSIKETKLDYFNDKCLGCHQTSSIKECLKAPESTKCISCHMQKSGTVDIPHVTVTDHYIRVYEDEVEETVKSDEQDFIGLVCLTNKKPSFNLKAQAYLNFFEKFDNNKVFLDSAFYYLNKIGKAENEKEWIQYFYLTGNTKQLANYGASIKNLKDLDAQTLYRLSTSFTNNLDKKIKLLTLAIDKENLRLDLRNELAIVYIKQQKFLKAQEQVDFVLNEFPKNETAINTKGFLYLVNGDFTMAKQMFDKALALNPDFEDALLNRAKVELASNNLEAADIWLLRLLKVNSNSADGLLLRKQLLLELNKG